MNPPSTHAATHHFPAAPWPTILKALSAFGALLLLAAGYGAAAGIPAAGGPRLLGSIMACLPPSIALGAVLFVVRSYELDADCLRIQRLLWPTVLRIDGLQAVRHDPAAMNCSLRLFGNGGLFSITGLFQNTALGRYRAFVTDPKHAVVLVMRKRVVVVSPAEPARFVETVGRLFPATVVGEARREA